MWMSIREYAKKYPWPTAAALRFMIWKMEKYGKMDLPFVRRYGRQILVDGDIFQAWFSENGSKPEFKAACAVINKELVLDKGSRNPNRSINAKPT